MSVFINKIKLFYFYIPAIILLFPTFPSIFQGQGEQIIFFIQFILFIILTKIQISKFKSYVARCLFFTFFLVLCLSIFFDIIKDQVIGSDFLELCRPIAAFYFYIFYRFSNLNITEIENTFEKLIFFIFTLLSIYAILEFIFPHIIRPISYFLYKRENMRVLSNKAIGSFSQTYTFAYILILPTIYGLNLFLKNKTFKYLIFFLLCFLSLLLTQSRSMYLTFAFAVGCCWFMPIYKKNIKNIIFVTTCLVLLLMGLYFLYLQYESEIRTTFAYAITGFELMITGNNNSVNTRQGQIDWALENNEFIFIGGGISKGVNRLLESFYSLYYYRTGLIGVLIFIGILIYTTFSAYKLSKMESHKKNSTAIFYSSLCVFYLVTPIGLLSSCHHDNPKICLLFYSLMALIHRKISIENKK